jgi:adenylate cyclase
VKSESLGGLVGIGSEVETPMSIKTAFVINRFSVDFGNETLCDPFGHPIVLRPQCFAVLRHLVENANCLVSKEDLMQAIWPGIAVTDDSIVQCVHQIRCALGDEGHAFLKTSPKRGYRLVIPLDAGEAVGTPREVSVPTAPHPGRVAIAMGVAFILAITLVWWGSDGGPLIKDPKQLAIAVMPFMNIGEDPQQNYFADGITEDLIMDLSKIPRVFVVARNSVSVYKGKSVPARVIAKELGVRYLLEGSVRRDGDEVRINAQMIDAVGDQQLWADRYNGDLKDVFTLQDKVVGNIVSALAVKLPNEDTVAVETKNPHAYDALLLGLERLHLDTKDDTLKAIASFEKAVELDGAYGRAYAAIADAELRIVLSNWSSAAGSELDMAYTKLNSNIARALERPTSQAYTVAAVWALQTGRNEQAFAFINKARVLAPNDPQVLVSEAMILNATGRAEEAEAGLRFAMRLDPKFAPLTLRSLSVALFQQGKYWEAVDTVERIKAQGAATTNDYITLVSSLGHLSVADGVKDAIDRYNTMAVPLGRDPMSVQEPQWYWNGNLFNYHRPYVSKLVEGLRKAGVPEGAGMDVPFDQYKLLVTRGSDGEFSVKGATKLSALAAGALYDRGVLFVDVRSRGAFANDHIPGAVNLSVVFDLSDKELAKVAGPKDEVVFYCSSSYCEYSAIAAAKAVTWGYTRVYLLAGGLPAWVNANCPIEVASQPRHHARG